jgi:hypothetical protein
MFRCFFLNILVLGTLGFVSSEKLIGKIEPELDQISKQLKGHEFLAEESNGLKQKPRHDNYLNRELQNSTQDPLATSTCNTTGIRSGLVEYNNVSYTCKDGTYSLHNSYFNSCGCFDCNSNMICKDGIIKPYSGVWRHNDQDRYFLVFRKCPNEKACINNYTNLSNQNPDNFQNYTNSNYSYLTICAKNYDGKFCDSCVAGTTKTSIHTCSSCPSKVVNAFLMIAAIVAIIVVVFILVFSTITTTFQPEELYSIGLRIFVNYVQIIYLCLQYKVKWPTSVQTVTLSGSDNSQDDKQTSNYFFSIKCLAANYGNYISENDMFYYRIYIVVGLPVLFFIGSCLIVGLLRLCKAVYKLKNYNHVAFIVPFLLIYPTVLSYSTSPFACVSLGDGIPIKFNEQVSYYEESYLVENRDIVCNQSHYFRSLAALLIGIILWGILIPAFIFYKIYEKRKNLFGDKVRYRYGFLINGYKLKRYYWEFVILFKKSLIVFLTVFTESQYSVNYQSVLILSTLTAFLIAQLYLEPYKIHQLNIIETLGIIASIFTVLLGIIYTNTSNVVTSYIIAIFILVLNFGFIVYIGRFIVKDYIEVLIKSIEFLKKRFQRKDDFDDNTTREFARIKFIYVKDSHKIYTQIEDEVESQVNYCRGLRTANDLYRVIVRTNLKNYKERVGPSFRLDARRQSIFNNRA